MAAVAGNEGGTADKTTDSISFFVMAWRERRSCPSARMPEAIRGSEAPCKA